LHQVVKNQNIEIIEVEEGDIFDPSNHEAVGTVTVTDAAQDNKVIGVVRSGYTLNDKVIRPVRVVVGQIQI